MLIILDGTEGGGKSTIIEAWKNYLTEQGKSVFDLKKYWKEARQHPSYPELKSCDFIFGYEPTGVGVGLVVRNELIQKDNNYPSQAIADGYSLDRLIFYTKIVIPALADNKCVILDRGITTSIAYQSMQEGLSMEKVANLVGNQLALKHRPDHLIIADISPEKAMSRLNARTDKKDDAIFEKLDFMKKLDKQYHSQEYRDFIEKYGIKIHYLSTDLEIDIMKQEAVDLLKKLISA